MSTSPIVQELAERFGAGSFVLQRTADGIPTVWVGRERLVETLAYLKAAPGGSYPMLYDLTAIDERSRAHREGQPPSDFTMVYHLLSFDRNEDIRIKLALAGDRP